MTMSAAELEAFIRGRTVRAVDPVSREAVARVTYRVDGVCVLDRGNGQVEEGRYGLDGALYWTRYPAFRDGAEHRFSLVDLGGGQAQAYHDDGRMAYRLESA